MQTFEANLKPKLFFQIYFYYCTLHEQGTFPKISLPEKKLKKWSRVIMFVKFLNRL